MSQSITKEQILEALRKEGITSIDELAEQAAQQAQKKASSSGKSPVLKTAGAFITIVAG